MSETFWIKKVRSVLLDSVSSLMHPENGQGPCVIFSGGLDTGLLVHLASEFHESLPCFTVLIGKNAPDQSPSVKLAKLMKLRHTILELSYRDLLSIMPHTVRILKTFDPMELRNSVVVHAALSKIKAAGFVLALTGDGADELFAGYSFLFKKKDRELKSSLRRLWKVMGFSAPKIGKALGIKVSSPYLKRKVRELALNLPLRYLRGSQGKELHGKYILRKAFPELPDFIRWRTKTPIEQGSGSTHLGRYIKTMISPSHFNQEKSHIYRKDKLHIRDPEHLYYYKLYKMFFGPPRKAKSGKICPGCGAGMYSKESDFCTLCGHWSGGVSL